MGDEKGLRYFESEGVMLSYILPYLGSFCTISLQKTNVERLPSSGITVEVAIFQSTSTN